MSSCSMDGKKQEKKSTRYRFLETLADSSIPKLFLKVFLPVSQAVFGLLTLSQFEELLLDVPEVDAIAAPAGLLVDTDLRM